MGLTLSELGKFLKLTNNRAKIYEIFKQYYKSYHLMFNLSELILIQNAETERFHILAKKNHISEKLDQNV